MRGRVLDLFCGGGGASAGYLAAGMEVHGIDFVRRQAQPAGMTFVKADVRDVLATPGFAAGFDFIHASPPCKENTRLGHLTAAQGGTPIHRDMLVEVREALASCGVPYVIENVPGAAMRADVMLCGSMFVLGTWRGHEWRWLQRHRLFELGGWGNYGVGIQPECCHPLTRPLGVYGSAGDEIPDGGQVAANLQEARELLGMPWASWESCTQAIPPAYTKYLAECFLAERESGHLAA